MRDKLIHDYIGVDLWAVWGVIDKIIPKFDKQIQEIIKIEKGGGRPAAYNIMQQLPLFETHSESNFSKHE